MSWTGRVSGQLDPSNVIQVPLAQIQDIAKPVTRLCNGYFLGGRISIGNNRKIIDKLTISTITISSLSSQLNTEHAHGAGVNSSIKGYVMSSLSGNSEIGALLFSTEVASALSDTISEGREVECGVNSSSKGYAMGGGASTLRTKIDDLNFSTEVSNLITATIGTARWGGGGCNSSTKGYMMGGDDQTAYPNSFRAIDSLTFSNESCSVITATVTQARMYASGFNSTLKGYSSGGWSNSEAAQSVDALTFSNESCSVLGVSLGINTLQAAGLNSSEKGFWGGSWNPTNVINSLRFSDESRISVSATLSNTLSWPSGVQSGGIL